MLISGNSAGKTSPDTPGIIKCVSSPAEARALPPGSVVGDLYGGVTFSDAVAHVLESRSLRGWREVAIADVSWTIIQLNR
ncbi:MAG: hypothetical protein DMG57_32230 [Acidobacteria bacterium]|nr:MAG: hypothetical protein DMG57_32230 [Acidobacteriota bacterium]